MRQIRLNDLDIFNAGSIVLCNPDVYFEVEKYILKMEDDHHPRSAVFRPQNIKIEMDGGLSSHNIEYIFPEGRIGKFILKILGKKLGRKFRLIKERKYIVAYILDDYIVAKSGIRYTQHNSKVVKIRNGVYIPSHQRQLH